MIARPNVAAVCGTTASSISPSRTCKCQSSGRAIVSVSELSAAGRSAVDAAAADAELLHAEVRSHLDGAADLQFTRRTDRDSKLLIDISTIMSGSEHELID